MLLWLKILQMYTTVLYFTPVPLCYAIYHLYSIHFLLYTEPYCNLRWTVLQTVVYTAD